MKISIISPNKNHLQEMSKLLEAQAHTVSVVDGGKSKMHVVAEREQPDLMLVDGMCCDPEELTLVEYVTTHHPQVAVILLCATQTPEFLIRSMRAGVREVLPSPASPEVLEAAIGRVAAKLQKMKRPDAGKVLAFIPCKGGSGATFVAINLACQLAETSSVLLIDLNLQFGDALAFVSDGKAPSSVADVAHDISRLDASFLVASTVKVAPNFSVLAAPEDLTKAMEVKAEHIDAIIGLAVTLYDFVLLDIGRNLNNLAIRALDRAHRIYPVLQPGLPALRNATKLMAVFKSLGYPAGKTELIVNRFEKAGEIGVAEIQRSLNATPVLVLAESTKDVDASINRGVPLVQASRAHPVSRSLAEFALSLVPRQEQNTSLFARLFRRA
ncbi:AAA family ATPase [Variovorax guangxiensis]|uniref:AAA family ATPase n=1 Tax=Variovorax guangxiensis TaxID=1775474 RepID=UPI00285C2EC6|nr:AAA family ATPase [Variovorax guangxiensis]MDR6857404.1 pilus assembly protein CpaE [Variovorax guangxiensis]